MQRWIAAACFLFGNAALAQDVPEEASSADEPPEPEADELPEPEADEQPEPEADEVTEEASADDGADEDANDVAEDDPPNDVADDDPPNDVADEDAAEERPSSTGNALLLSYGALSGAYVGGSLGWLATPEGAVTGGVLGAGVVPATVFFLTRDEDVTVDQAVTVASAGGLGAFTGIQAGRLFIPSGAQRETERIVLAGVLGNMAGTGLGVALMPSAPGADEMWALNTGSVVGWQTGVAFNDVLGLDQPGDRQARAGVSLGSALGFGTAMYALRATGAPRPTASLTTISMLHGSWAGLWAPYIMTPEPRPRHRWAGLRLGLGTGYVASQVLAPLVEPEPRSAALQATGIAAGNALGAGIPMLLGHDPSVSAREVVLPMLAGGFAGQALGASLSPYWELTEEDAVLLSVLGLWTGYQAIGWGFFGHHLGEGPAFQTGAALTAAGTGTLISMGATPMLDLRPPESLMVGTAGGWGTWYGGWLGHLTGMDPRAHWITTLAAGNAALLGTTAALAGPMDAQWEDVALINGMTAVGGASGALIGVIASPELDTVATASVVGTTLGLGTGIVLATGRDDADQTTASLPDLPQLGRFPLQSGLQLMPWAGEDGQPGARLELTVHEIAQ